MVKMVTLTHHNIRFHIHFLLWYHYCYHRFLISCYHFSGNVVLPGQIPPKMNECSHLVWVFILVAFIDIYEYFLTFNHLHILRV